MASFKIYYGLMPLSVLYGMVVSLRNKLFDWGILKEKCFDLPIICVGNIAVGGTGKTPHIEYLIRLLSPRYRVAVLSRGYKRKSKGFQLGSMNSTPELLGDEPFQILAKFPMVVVAVDSDRRNGILQLLSLPDRPDVILLDDAFQHRYVKAGLNILLTDYNRRIDQDFILPAGRLRESKVGIKRADLIVVTKCPERVSETEMRELTGSFQLLDHQQLYFSGLKYGLIENLFSNEKRELCKTTSVLLVTGIAQPYLLEKYIGESYSLEESIVFPDHYQFSQSDILKIKNKFDDIKNKDKVILVTEKDAVRLRHTPLAKMLLTNNLYFLPLEIVFLQKHTEKFNQTILDYVAKNPRNSRIPS